MSCYYQTYRPKQFRDVTGHKPITMLLTKQVLADSYHHAYLIHGPSGTGKTTLARLIAMSANCENGIMHTGEPCGECSSCRNALKQSHWDILEVDAARCRGIDDIKSLVYKACFAPFGKRKVYIIDEVHCLTGEAFSVLLKFLEEPPPHVMVILTTTEIGKIPDTIMSRCAILQLKALTAMEIKTNLEMVCRSEDKAVGPEMLTWIAETATGNLRRAQNCLEEVITIRS